MRQRDFAPLLVSALGSFSSGAVVVARGRADRSGARDHVCHSLLSWPFAGAVRSGCRLGRHFCGSNRFARRMVRVPATREHAAAFVDLEPYRNGRSDCRCGTGSNFFARSAAFDFRRTQLSDHDNFAMALDPRFSGTVIVRSSHRRFHSLGEAQRRLTSNFLSLILGAIRLATAKSQSISALRFSYPRELEFGTPSLSQCHVVTRDFDLINCGGKRRLDFNSVIVSETVPAWIASNEDRPILRKFPNRCA